MIDRRQEPIRAAAGFSLIEVMIALAVLGVVLAGVLTMMAQATLSNNEGAQLTAVTTRARTHMEELLALPFNDPDLEVPAGADELVVTEHWVPTLGRWVDEADLGPDLPSYTRVTTIRQFNMSAISLDDGGDREFEDDEALPGGSTPDSVHLKSLEIRVSTGDALAANLGGRQQKVIVVRAMKSV